MTRNHQNMVIRAQVRLEPHDGTEVQVIGGLVEEEEVRLDEERAGEGDLGRERSASDIEVVWREGRGRREASRPRNQSGGRE